MKKSYVILLTGSVFSLFGLVQVVRWQSKSDSLKVNLRPLQVEASRFGNTPETMSLATIQVERNVNQLNRDPDATLDRISFTIPGLWVNNRQNYSLGERITMRGIGWRSQFGVRGIQILFDDIPLTTADGQSMTEIVDPSFIRNIRVIRGPASVFWGNSTGGVIDLSTYSSGNSGYHFRIRELAGSYGFNKTDLEIHDQFGKNQFQIFTSYLDQKGFRDHSKTHLGRGGIYGEIPINEQSGLTVTGAFETMPLALNPGSLTLGQAINDPSMARPDYVSYDVRKKVNQGQLGVQYHNYTHLGSLQMMVFGIFRNLRNPLNYAYIKLNRLAGGDRFTLQNENRWFKWNIGYEGKWQHDNRINWENNQGGVPVPGDSLAIDQLEQIFNHALFGGISVPISNWTVSGGVRFDHLLFKANDHIHETNKLNNETGRRVFNAFSPTIGIRYRTGVASLYANMSTAFEAPTTTELVNRPGGGGGFNTAIGPEHTLSFEIGMQGKTGFTNLKYDVSIYAMSIKDMLMPYQDSSGRTFYRNAGKTRHIGFEAYLKWRINRKLRLDFMYSGMHGVFANSFSSTNSTSYNGNDIPGIPQRRFSGKITWNFQPIWLSADMETTSRYFVNNENTVYNHAYTVLNVRLSSINILILKRLFMIPFIAVNNVTNTRYNGSVLVNTYGGRYFEPAPGRNWKAGITFQY